MLGNLNPFSGFLKSRRADEHFLDCRELDGYLYLGRCSKDYTCGNESTKHRKLGGIFPHDRFRFGTTFKRINNEGN